MRRSSEACRLGATCAPSFEAAVMIANRQAIAQWALSRCTVPPLWNDSSLGERGNVTAAATVHVVRKRRERCGQARRPSTAGEPREGTSALVPLFGVLDKPSLPQSLESHAEALLRLAQTYKAINAPLGPLAKASLQISTATLASGDPSDDAKYQHAETFLAGVTSARDALAAKMIAALDAAEFHDIPVDPGHAFVWATEADLLVAAVQAAAATF